MSIRVTLVIFFMTLASLLHATESFLTKEDIMAEFVARSSQQRELQVINKRERVNFSQTVSPPRQEQKNSGYTVSTNLTSESQRFTAPGVLIADASRLSKGNEIEREERQFSVEGIKKIQINHQRGNVKVVGADVSRVTVTVVKQPGHKCTSKAAINKKILVVQTSAPWGTGLSGRKQECGVAVEVVVPQNLFVALHLEGGIITLDNVEGDLSVYLKGGQVNGHVASANASFDISFGMAEVQWDRLPEKGRLQITGKSTSSTFLFPKGSRVKSLSVKEGFGGSIENKLKTDPSASFLITGKVSLGTVETKYQP